MTRRGQVDSLSNLIVAAEGIRVAKFLAEMAAENLTVQDGTETKEQVEEITQGLISDLDTVCVSIKRAMAAFEVIHPGFTLMVEQFDPPERHELQR